MTPPLPRFLALAAILATAGILFAETPRPGAPVLTVDQAGVRVDNVTPGGDVILLSCAKRARNGVTFSETLSRQLHDQDGDGVVVLPDPVPFRSVWIAIDYQTGAAAAGARPGYPLELSAIAPTLFRKDAAEEIVALEQRVTRLMLLIVRPGQGAWTLRAREGGYGDHDGEGDNRLVLAFEDAAPVGEGKERAPRNLKHGDVVAAVDLGNFEVFLSQVTK